MSSHPPYLPLSHLDMVHEDAADDLGLVSDEAVLANTWPFHRGLIRQLHTSTNQTVWTHTLCVYVCVYVCVCVCVCVCACMCAWCWGVKRVECLHECDSLFPCHLTFCWVNIYRDRGTTHILQKHSTLVACMVADLSLGWEGAGWLSSLQLELTQVVGKLYNQMYKAACEISLGTYVPEH